MIILGTSCDLTSVVVKTPTDGSGRRRIPAYALAWGRCQAATQSPAV